jgi:hypothetical protein
MKIKFFDLIAKKLPEVNGNKEYTGITFRKLNEILSKEAALGKAHDEINISIADYSWMMRDSASMRHLAMGYNAHPIVANANIIYHSASGSILVCPDSGLKIGEYSFNKTHRIRTIIQGACKFCGTDPGTSNLCQNCGASTAWN